VSERPGLDLGRPRDVVELLRDAGNVFFRHPETVLVLGAAIVIPVELVVLGVGLEQLSGPYEARVSNAELGVSTAVSFFVIVPLVTAAVIGVLDDDARGERPRAGRSLQAALDAFAPLLGALVLAALGIALGLLALILPGIYLLVRWYFVPQAVMVAGERGRGALEASASTVQGSWWRTAGIVLLVNLLLAGIGLLVLAPVRAAAEAADREAVALAGTIVLDIVTVTYTAVVSTLLFHDLRARKSLGL